MEKQPEQQPVKTYTQEEVNKIVEDVKANQLNKFDKKISSGYVEVEKYNELENKVNSLLIEKKATEFKEVFISNNGNEKAFNDFINLNKDILTLDKNKQIEKLKEYQQSKSHFFNKQAELENNIFTNNANSIRNIQDLLQPKKEYVEGTIYEIERKK